jgi:hypothetical protein
MTEEEEKNIRTLLKKIAVECMSDAKDVLVEHFGDMAKVGSRELHANLSLKLLEIRWNLTIMDAKDMSYKQAMKKMGLGGLVDD